MRFVPWMVRLVARTPVALPAVAGEGRLAGPVMAEVKRVVDGDTLAVRTQIWLDQEHPRARAGARHRRAG